MRSDHSRASSISNGRSSTAPKCRRSIISTGSHSATWRTCLTAAALLLFLKGKIVLPWNLKRALAAGAKSRLQKVGNQSLRAVRHWRKAFSEAGTTAYSRNHSAYLVRESLDETQSTSKCCGFSASVNGEPKDTNFRVGPNNVAIAVC